MTDAITADDLALLGESFVAALDASSDPEATMIELGWHDVLSAAGRAGFEPAFGALGSTGAAAGILDDVVANTLGSGIGTCVLHPAPHRSDAPGVLDAEMIVLDGVVSTRYAPLDPLIVPLDNGGLATFPSAAVAPSKPAIDVGGAYRRLRGELPLAEATTVDSPPDDASEVADAQVAVAHELLGAARWMLSTARDHAVDRSQFGRPVASFQAIRHKLAEALVAVEGAESVTRATLESDDPLLAAIAKSLAGQAALTTAKHAQQVLGGIGFTDDHPFHRRYKRVLTLDTLYGSATSLPAVIGAALHDRGTAPRLIEL